MACGGFWVSWRAGTFFHTRLLHKASTDSANAKPIHPPLRNASDKHAHNPGAADAEHLSDEHAYDPAAAHDTHLPAVPRCCGDRLHAVRAYVLHGLCRQVEGDGQRHVPPVPSVAREQHPSGAAAARAARAARGVGGAAGQHGADAVAPAV
eukprot:1090750-Prymnesium_polylepis.1